MNLPIWMYWEGDKPEWIKDCHRSIFDHGEDVRLLTPADFDKLRDRDRDIDLSQFCIAHRADFIRAFLVSRFGGVWIDSDCIAMRSLQPLIDKLDDHDLFAFRERSGNISNSFIGARQGSRIAQAYYDEICEIIRSGRPIEWQTIGAHALDTAIRRAGVRWHEIDVSLIQPVCWSKPEAFFMTRDTTGHMQVFNEPSFCYMLSGNMTNGFMAQHPGRDLLEDGTFFNFLLKISADRKLLSYLEKIAFRKNTDDDMWIIPELVEHDMYKVKNVLRQYEPPYKSYVLDCGAHIGAFSIMCSLYLRDVEIFSFEPNPESFYYLSQNAGRLRNVTAFNKAVDVKEGVLQLFAPDDEAWTGRWSVSPNSNRSIDVEAVNLNAFIKSLDGPVFILKLDLEGYEELILNEFCEEALAAVKIMVIETHRDFLDHQRLMASGFQLLFRPEISTHRQFIYIRN
ncbi:MAG: FkbM family methyltransferase [Chitinophagaceae bacterium]|nr:FkbM family methyltransferase [Chitinophagaceae bacterium]